MQMPLKHNNERNLDQHLSITNHNFYLYLCAVYRSKYSKGSLDVGTTLP